MSTPAQASVDELVAAFAAGTAGGSALAPLAALVAQLRAPLRDAAFWAQVADALIRNGFAEPAAALLAVGLQHHPRAAELHYLRGNALRMVQRPAEAEPELRAALALRPAHRQAALSLAFMLRELGRINAAADVVLSLWREQPGDAGQALELLGFLRESGAPAQARVVAEEAYRRWNGDARIAAATGELALAFGDFTRAHETLHRAVTLDPAQSSAWLRLAYCRRYAQAEDTDLALFAAASSNPRLAAPVRICAGFALGKAYDDLDDCRNAAAVLRDANALARSESPWSAADWRALTLRQLAQPALPALDADPGFVPVFIVGLPRTGTTLVATRLARHPTVHDRGELNWVAAMYEHLSAQDALGDRAALASVAALVKTQMRRDDAPARCYVDKNPLNFRFLNLIAALFPNARIVHCRRNARDTALSLWSQHFAHPDLAFAYDFAAIAAVQASESEFLAHWRSVLPVPILDVDYETLVAAPGEQFRRIAEFSGLVSDTAPGDAESGSAIITTASVWQARQPVYTQAVGRWRHYAPFVPELVDLFA